MELDDEICLCFHVTKRKIVNYIRVEKPRRAGQLSECQGAGTGCGWCRPYLEQCFQEAVAGRLTQLDDPSPEEYARRRARYIGAGSGVAPRDDAATEDDEA
ncbi:MAG: (2Fe-2S)-binding protein [Pirellulales bacterium]